MLLYIRSISKPLQKRTINTSLPAYPHRILLTKYRRMSNLTSDREGTVYITPNQSPTATVIFAHGLGDTADGWSDAMHHISTQLKHVKFILPTAKTQPVTLNMGMSMPSWYDIKSLTKTEDDGADGIQDSQARIQAIINKEVEAGIPMSRIVMGGFSQGGALSLYTGFQLNAALAGILCLSGYIPAMKRFNPTPETKDVPLLMCHGSYDNVVQYGWGQQSKLKLESLGVKNIEFKTYEGMGHSACPEELDDITTWLQHVLPPQTQDEL